LPVNLFQEVLQLIQRFLGKPAGSEIFNNMGIICPDVVLRLVFLVVPAHQVVHRHEGVGDICSKVVRFRDADVGSQLGGGHILQDTPR
jgi:hypothetical protein